MFITPFLVSLLGYVFAHEKLDMSAIIGGGIILFGVAIFNFGDKIFRHINHN
jgi:drug/metabolite transporter (DMT)-like permease